MEIHCVTPYCLSSSSQKFLEWPKQQHHHEDHYSHQEGFCFCIFKCFYQSCGCCLATVSHKGLDYLTEYQMEDPNSDPCYICDLCQSKMDMRQVINHVVGIRHRHKYMVSCRTIVLHHYMP